MARALDQFGHVPQDYTPEQVALIEEGLAQIARGEVVSHEDLMREVALIQRPPGDIS